MSLTAYIKQDLQNRIASRDHLTDRITLVGLAEHYKVSITPVRIAIGQLIDEGLVLKGPGGKLSPRFGIQKAAARRPVANGELKVVRPLTPVDWDKKLIDEIMLESLRYEPVYLREEALSSKFNVGRSIIRQTLHRFAGSRLIEHVPRRGWLVRPFSHEDMRSFIRIRQLLEIEALELARPRVSKVDIKRLLDANTIAKKGSKERLDNSLHKYFIERSGNRYLMEFFEQHVALYYEALFGYAAPETSMISNSIRQHRRFLAAILNDSWQTARRELIRHIRYQGRLSEQLISLIKKRNSRRHSRG